MTFDNMIEYQNIDIKLSELEKQFNANSIVATYLADINFINQATKYITEYKAKAESLSKKYDKLVASLNEISADIDEFKSIESTDKISEIDYYIKNLNSILGEIADLEKELSQVKSEISSTIDGHNKLFAEGVKRTKEKKSLQESFEGIKKKFVALKAEFEAKLNAIKPSIPPIFLDKYETLKKDGKLPAFKEYNPNNKADKCSGCNMEIPIDVQKNLKKSGDFCECPNCHRILFIK